MKQSASYLLLFLCYAVTGFALQVTPFVDREFVAPFILGITAASSLLIEIFGGSVDIFGDILRSPISGFAVKVDNGCSGLEAVILICAAVLAFPTTWKLRLIGVLGCSAAILGVNLIRIISLFYIGQYSMKWFEWAHLYAWDILIMVDGVIAILLWIRYAIPRTPQPA